MPKGARYQGKANPPNQAEDPRLAILWNVFLARKDAYMEHKDGWLCIKQEITREDIAAHLAGQRRLGSYLLSPQSTVRWLVFDFDSHDNPQAKPGLKAYILPLVKWFREQSMGTLIEDTGGVGYHVWVLFHEDLYANKVIRLANYALRQANITFAPEVFPKQTRLGAGEFGNGMRLPWGLHASGKWSHFLDDDFEPDDDSAIKVIMSCRIINWKTLDQLLPQKGAPLTTAKGIAPGRWDNAILEGARHSSMLALAGELRARRFPPERILSELRTHNEQRCQPPLGDAEIEQIFEGILKMTGVTEVTSERESQADLLVKVAVENVNLFHTPDMKGYVFFNNGAKQEIWPLRSTGFKRWLSREAYKEFGKVPYNEAMNMALYTLEGVAQWDKEEKALHLRVAWDDDTLWYDLGDWEAIKVTEKGWTVEKPPILFRHYSHQLPQSHPQPGSIEEFLDFVNIESESERALLLTYLATSLIPDIPQPILFVHGDQGSGKSLFLRFVREIVDPSAVGLLTVPDNLREFGQLGYHHRAVYLDNVHTFSPWLIEGFSRLATGACFTKRALFTDEDDVVFANKGLGGFTGVSLEVDAPDLLDRGIFFKLNRVPEERAKPEEELIAAFNEAKPRILGGVFATLSGAIRLRPQFNLTRFPRMADYFSWASLVADVLGLENFSQAFWDNVKYQSQQALDASIIAPAIEKFMSDKEEWSGTSTELLTALNRHTDDETQRLKGWPQDPCRLSRKVSQLIPNLVQAGIQAKKEKGKREWLFRRSGENSVLSVPADSQPKLTLEESLSVPSQNMATDAKNAKKRYQKNLASNTPSKVPDAKNANSSLNPSKKANFYAPDGTPVMQDDWIKKWKEKGSKPIRVRDGKIRDLKKYLDQDELNLENLTLIRDFLWPKGDWPREQTQSV